MSPLVVEFSPLVGIVSLAIALISLALSWFIYYKSSNHLSGISVTLNEKISNIEELTRKPLTSFPSIFRHADEMIESMLLADKDPDHEEKYPDDFFWILNYTPYFGGIHSYNSEYKNVDEYRNDSVAKNLATLSLKFTAKLEGLAKTLPDFRIVTVHPKEFEDKFLSKIINNFGYSEPPIKIINDVNKNHKLAIENILRNLESQNKINNIRFVNKVSTQMMLAKVNGELKCLVFSTMFLKDKQNPKTHYIRGYYTQLEPIVEFYCDRFLEVFDSASRGRTKEDDMVSD